RSEAWARIRRRRTSDATAMQDLALRVPEDLRVGSTAEHPPPPPLTSPHALPRPRHVNVVPAVLPGTEAQRAQPAGAGRGPGRRGAGARPGRGSVGLLLEGALELHGALLGLLGGPLRLAGAAAGADDQG